MPKIKRTPKKVDAIPVSQFCTLKKGDTFRNKVGSQDTCSVLMKMDDFYTEDEDSFNCVDILSGKVQNIDSSTTVIMTTCYLDVTDGVA